MNATYRVKVTTKNRLGQPVIFNFTSANLAKRFELSLFNDERIQSIDSSDNGHIVFNNLDDAHKNLDSWAS